MVRALFAGAVLSLLAVGAGASAQEAAVTRGRVIAETWCVTCHAIGEGNQPSALADAPPFKSLAGAEGVGVERVRQALLLPHPVMPEFPLTSADIEALAAYIDTLATHEPATPEQRTQIVPGTVRGDVVLVAMGDGSATRGRAIVMRNCSPCHRIEGLGESPVPAAPAFATLSERYPVSDLAEALAEGIMVGHEGAEMPQFVFQPDEIAAIIAHLGSVQVPR